MRFCFRTKDLEALYYHKKKARRYPPGVVEAFFEAMVVISSAVTEHDLRAMKSFHFEKLVGNRKDQASLRLNDQFRLIIHIHEEAEFKIIEIIEIVDYH